MEKIRLYKDGKNDPLKFHVNQAKAHCKISLGETKCNLVFILNVILSPTHKPFTVIYGKKSLTLNVTALENIFEVDRDSDDIYFASAGSSSKINNPSESLLFQIDSLTMKVKSVKKIHLIVEENKDKIAMKSTNQIAISGTIGTPSDLNKHI